MATSAEIGQQYVAVQGPAIGGQLGKPANTADPADTEQIGLEP